MTARQKLSVFLTRKLPEGWNVGPWARGVLVCTGHGARLSVTDLWRRPDGRWHGFVLETGNPADWEGHGDWYGRGGWPTWPEDLADQILAAVARIGTREPCSRCSGTGGGEQSCGTCGGEGRVIRVAS